jgi:DNA-binding MarR family transcriptional regulator
MSFDAASVRAQREQMLLRLLFRATHAMNAEMTRRVRARGWTAFKPTFTTLLSHLDTDGTTISELAARIGTSRQAVSQLARAIEEAGLIERMPHPTDGRSVVVCHTAAGRRILLHALDVMSAIEAEYADRAGETEVGELKRLLAHLLGEIDPAGALQPDEQRPPGALLN